MSKTAKKLESLEDDGRQGRNVMSVSAEAEASNELLDVHGLSKQFLRGRAVYVDRVIQPAVSEILEYKGVPMGGMAFEVHNSWSQIGKENRKRDNVGYRPANFWFADVGKPKQRTLAVNISPRETDPEQACIHVLDAKIHGFTGEIKYQGAWRKLAKHCGLAPNGGLKGSKAWTQPGFDPKDEAVKRIVAFHIHGLSRGKGNDGLGLPDDGVPAGQPHHEVPEWEFREDEDKAARASIAGGKGPLVPVFQCPFWNEVKGEGSNCDYHTIRLPKHFAFEDEGEGPPRKALDEDSPIKPCSTHDRVFKDDDGNPKRAFLINAKWEEEEEPLKVGDIGALLAEDLMTREI